MSELTPPYRTQVTELFSGTAATTCTNMPSISFSGSNPFTFEAWVYFDALADSMNIVSRPNEFTFGTRGGALYAARTSQVLAAQSAAVLEHHRWYHVAVTFDGVTMQLWLNGTQVALVTVSDPGVQNQGQPVTVGGGFYGQIRMVRCWNAFVNANQLYANQFTSYPTSTTGLAAQFDFGQFPAVDTSGNNVPTTPSQSGQRLHSYAPAAHLSGDGFIDPYSDTNINPSGAADFSLMSWVKLDQLQGPATLFGNGVDGGGAGTSLTVQPNGTVSFKVGSQSIASTAALGLQMWQNVAATWTASSGTASLYINGVADTTQSGVSGGAAPSTGSPLLGSLSSQTSAVPTNGVVGHIQSVSVWGRALTAANVATYTGANPPDPVEDTTCTADYDFSNPPPQNSISLNLLGLVGTTVLRNDDDTTELSANAERRTIAEASPPGIAVTLTDAELQTINSEDAVQNYVAFARKLGLSGAQLDYVTKRFRDNLQRGADDVRAGRMIAPLRVRTEDRGNERALIFENGSESVEIPCGTLDPCTTWAIGFLIALGGTLWSVLGFSLNLSKVQAGLTNFLSMRINNIGLVPQLRVVFNSGLSANAVYNALSVLYEFGLLIPMGKMLWQAVKNSISIFTILSVGARIVLLFGPFAPLEIAVFVTELGYSLYTLYTTWNDPNNCWKT